MLITPQQAFEQKLRDIYLTAEGIVAEILPDDTIGTPHQRFILLTPTDQTILIVHNIDRGDQFEVKLGDHLKVEGTYVWNHRGGLIHETHLGINKNQPDGSIITIKSQKSSL